MSSEEAPQLPPTEDSGAADNGAPQVEEMSEDEAKRVMAAPALVRRLSQEEQKDMFYHSETLASEVHGHQLLSLEHGQLAVSVGGEAVLSKLDPSRQLNLVFIFGNARSGKSFMMNCLSGRQGIFQVLNTAEPCTKGVDISSYVMEHSHLAQHTKQAAVENNPLLGFVDVEGQGAEDGAYDTMLALPLLLTSKVCLFNHKGAPTVTDMLSRLGVVARAADFVNLNSKSDVDTGNADDEDSESDGDEKRIGGQGKKRKFGHLHILFRDFSFDATKEMVHEQLFTKEVVKKKGIGGELAAKAAKERNDIRQLLTDNFQSINVWLFKQPALASELKAHKELPAHLVDPEFAHTVKELLSTIAVQTAEPTLFNDSPVTGPKLHDIMGRVCSVLNTGEAINVPSVYFAMEKDTVLKVGKRLKEGIREDVEKLRGDLPLPVAKLQEQVAGIRQRAHADFGRALTSCTLEEELKKEKESMDGVLNVLVEEMSRANHDATMKWMNTQVMNEVVGLREQFEAWCKSALPVDSADKIHSAFKESRGVSYESLMDTLSALPDIPDAEIKARWAAEEHSLDEFLMTKVLKNEALQKEQHIARLQQESIEIQTKLVDKNKMLDRYLAQEKEQTAAMEKQLQAAKDAEVARLAEQKKQEALLQSEIDASKAAAAKIREEAAAALQRAKEDKEKEAEAARQAIAEERERARKEREEEKRQREELVKEREAQEKELLSEIEQQRLAAKRAQEEADAAVARAALEKQREAEVAKQAIEAERERARAEREAERAERVKLIEEEEAKKAELARQVAQHREETQKAQAEALEARKAAAEEKELVRKEREENDKKRKALEESEEQQKRLNAELEAQKAELARLKQESEALRKAQRELKETEMAQQWMAERKKKKDKKCVVM